MSKPPETYLTVRQHADALARKRYPEAWRQHRDEPLEQLLPAIWLDEFEDEKLRCLLFDRKDVKRHRKGYLPAPGQLSLRKMLYHLLPKGGYWVPDAVKKTHDDEFLWGGRDGIAALHASDYEDQWLHGIIEQVIIPGTDFERWKARHWAGNPQRRGRKPYEAEDKPLIDEMQQRLVNKESSSRRAAALEVVDRAAGRGELESKLRRLTGKHKAKYGESF